MHDGSLDVTLAIRTIDRTHAFSENIHGDNREEIEAYLWYYNAFYEDTEGRVLQIRERVCHSIN